MVRMKGIPTALRLPITVEMGVNPAILVFNRTYRGHRFTASDNFLHSYFSMKHQGVASGVTAGSSVITTSGVYSGSTVSAGSFLNPGRSGGVWRVRQKCVRDKEIAKTWT